MTERMVTLRAGAPPADSTSADVRLIRLVQIALVVTLLAGVALFGWVSGTATSGRLRATLMRRTGCGLRRGLGQLRGAWVKAGQLAGPLLPPDLGQALSTLRDHARPTPAHRVRRVVKSELGPVDKMFREFDWEHPVGVASVGQVHRAVLVDGRVVAVKVQHPKLGTSIATDMAVLHRALRLLSRWWRGLDVDELMTELRDQLEGELDYRREAEHQRRFAARFRDVPDIFVPDVVHATRRVLVTEFVDAHRLTDEELAGNLRDRAGELVYAFWLHGLVEHRELQVDVHAGNFLITSSGMLVALDFGQVKALAPGDVQQFSYITAACATIDDPRQLEGLMRTAGLFAGSDMPGGVLDQFIRTFRGFLDTDGAQQLDADDIRGLMMQFSGDLGRHLVVSPALAAILRSLAGVLTMIGCDLRARGDWGSMTRELWLERPEALFTN